MGDPPLVSVSNFFPTEVLNLPQNSGGNSPPGLVTIISFPEAGPGGKLVVRLVPPALVGDQLEKSKVPTSEHLKNPRD